MERRSLFQAGLAGVLGSIGIGLSARAAESSQRQKVVYHFVDLDRVAFGLNNVQNHVEGTGGPGKADIRIVVLGPALKAFHSISADADVTSRFEGLLKGGVRADACANTMRAQKVKLDELVAGFAVAEQGGVVRLAELQAQGYTYIRP